MLEILLISAGAVLETLFIMRSYKRRDEKPKCLSPASASPLILSSTRLYLS